MGWADIAVLNDGCCILRYCRQVTGWSQQAIASQLMVPLETVRSWERGAMAVPEAAMEQLVHWTGLCDEDPDDE